MTRIGSCVSCLLSASLYKVVTYTRVVDNLRYSFDYCVFGYPDATDVGSNPCITSEACGGLEEALKEGILDPQKREQYDYCNIEGNAMLSDAVERCRQCVKADRSHSFVSNCTSPSTISSYLFSYLPFSPRRP